MNKNKIKILNGKASFLSGHDILVEADGKQEVIKADQAIIASGSEPVELPFAPYDGKWVIHSGDAMALSAIPDSILIIGGGIIGCEFASIFSRMGAKVVIVEKDEQILPGKIRILLHFCTAGLRKQEWMF